MADEDGVKLLEAQVKKNSAYFSSLVELIPAKYYLPDDALQRESFPDLSNLSAKAAKQVKKRLAKKAKLLKLDPSQHKTVAELQKEIEEKEKLVFNEEPGDAKIQHIKVDEIASLPLDDLRQKLHDKMEWLRGKRKLKDVTKSEESAKKRKLEKNLRKKKRKEEGKSTGQSKATVEIEKKAAQIRNDEGDVVFSKFDFANAAAKKKAKKGSVEQLLKKAEKKKENIARLEDEDKEKANMVKSRIKWSKAFKQAEGEKVKDDPKLLLKTLKKKNKMKEVSKKKWEDRLNTQKKAHDDKQKTRLKNLKERRQGSKINKRKTGKKIMKHKPGF